MAEPPGAPLANPLLRGLFGAFQTSAAASASTADVWANLRTNAGSALFAAQGVAQPYDPAAVEEAGRQILSANGVNAANVSSFRGLAGEWRAAAERVQALEAGQQITAAAVFTPPWALTDNPDVPSRYRIRSQWQFESAAGDVFNQWVHDEITGPLTTTSDALGQVDPPKQTYPPQAVLAGAAPPTLLGFEVEQI